MWHEARRREKATQKLLNEHKKRAEKRREENRVDPISLLQVHGIKSKLHIDANTYKQAEKSLVVWQGDKNVKIDRFDVRATLTSIPTDAEAIVARKRCKSLPDELKRTTILDIDESDSMKKLLNYERYRLLMQNDLNQVPEQTRLKLVVKSEYLTDAHMKKLQNNRFGTSGESNYATTSQSSSNYSFNNNNLSSGSRLLNSREHQNSRKGVAVGYNCNQVPPPASLQASNDQDDNHDEKQQHKTILDLDEHENFDLDSIDDHHISSNTKRANEITSRYGLTSDEFGLLARRDQTDLQTLEMIRELKKLVEYNQKRDQNSELAQNPAGVYGPSLPPEMIAASASKITSPKSVCSGSSDGSPVRQRSPSGGNIPFRNGKNSSAPRSPVVAQPLISSREERLDDRLDQAKISTTSPPRDRHRRPSLTSAGVATASSRSFNTDQSHSSSLTRSSRDKPSTTDNLHHREQLRPTPRAKSPPPMSPAQVEHRSGSRSDDDIIPRRKEEPTRPRKRAETPLAYKRHCRSSRSLSRERRLNSRYQHQADHHSSLNRDAWRTSTHRYDEYRYQNASHHQHDHGQSRRRSYPRSPTRSRSRSRSGSYSGTSRSSYSSSLRFKTRSRSASYSSFYSNKSSADLRKSSSSAYMAERHQRPPRPQAAQQPPRRRTKKRRTGRRRRRRGGRKRRR